MRHRRLNKTPLTTQARAVGPGAEREAVRTGQEYVGPEHVLMFLLRDPEGRPAQLLSSLGVEPAAIRRRLEEELPPARLAPGTRPRPSPNTQELLRLAVDAAAWLGHQYVGPEHILVAIAKQTGGTVSRVVLARAGVTPEVIERAIRGAPATAGSRPSFRFAIDESSDKSIYEQIILRIQEAVATGELLPDDRLPPVRHLADELDIAPGTVARAYGELERLGVIVTDGARGTRIAPSGRASSADSERSITLAGLMHPVVVAAFHLGGSPEELRAALDDAIQRVSWRRGAA